ncbi:MAG: right-handed parallel beta-helix repeat-containing protein, partial [Thermoplasmata archaeon]
MYLRRGLLFAIATSVAMVLLLSIATADDTEARTVINGDVVVDHDLTWYDDVFEVHGNVTVEGGTRLKILHATVEIVGTHNGSHWFNATPGSTLTLDNGTIKGSPYPVGIHLGGIGHMVDSMVTNVWTSNVTPAIDLSGALTMLNTVVESAPDSTGILVTGSLEAESCEFRDLGLVSVRFSDPTIPGWSAIRNCSFEHPSAAAFDTFALSFQLSESITHTVDITVDGCSFDDFNYGVEAFLNSSMVNLTVTASDFTGCPTGMTVTGNEANLVVRGCTFDGSGTVGLSVYVLEPMMRPLDTT